jgi:hypothetical protein
MSTVAQEEGKEVAMARMDQDAMLILHSIIQACHAMRTEIAVMSHGAVIERPRLDYALRQLESATARLDAVQVDIGK